VSRELMTVSWTACIRLEAAEPVRFECREGRWTVSRDDEAFSSHPMTGTGKPPGCATSEVRRGFPARPIRPGRPNQRAPARRWRDTLKMRAG